MILFQSRTSGAISGRAALGGDVGETYGDESHKRGEVAREVRIDVARVERGGDDPLITVPPCELERHYHVGL